MCGIAGFLGRGRIDAGMVTAMIDPIAHRGPDDQGVWIDSECGIALGHRRLSIVDLSPQGHQPMASEDGRYLVSYNGEIYNHSALRAELAADGRLRAWRGQSDTETLVEAIAAWGLERTLERAVGMFAFALWDRAERQLHLVRDRFGEKPLYYGWAGTHLVFASELKGVVAHPDFLNAVSRTALRLMMARACVPAPFSIYERVFKLPPGCVLTIDAGSGFPAPRDVPPTVGDADRGLLLRRYWDYAEVVQAGLADPITDEAEALALLNDALAEAVRGQAVADVPVGAFLSGGIDSSAVVAFYRKHATGAVRTFSIGFEDAAFNEADHARAVARHLGTEHHELIVTPGDALDVIPLLPAIYDEPFADSSQIPTYLVSRFARGEVTVALSGDGGDEIFGGYDRHIAVPRLWSKLEHVPAPVRAAAGGLLSRVPADAWTELTRFAPGGRRRPHFGQNVAKGLRVLGDARSAAHIHALFLDHWSGGSPVVGGDPEAAARALTLPALSSAPPAVSMMYADAMTYLPDDILAKVDRAGMAVSLEGRVPFLDHRLAAAAARVSIDLKIRGRTGKAILRELLFREVPRELFDRPKAGFAVPLGDWLRGPLRPWAEELLAPSRLSREGFLDPAIVSARWKRHLARREDATVALWSVLMFQSWNESRRAGPSPRPRGAGR